MGEQLPKGQHQKGASQQGGRQAHEVKGKMKQGRHDDGGQVGVFVKYAVFDQRAVPVVNLKQGKNPSQEEVDKFTSPKK